MKGIGGGSQCEKRIWTDLNDRMALGGHLSCSFGPRFPFMLTAAATCVMLTLCQALFCALNNVKFISSSQQPCEIGTRPWFTNDETEHSEMM